MSRFPRRPEEIGGTGVQLTAEQMGDVGRLAELASAMPKSKRSEIYLAVATLFRVHGAHISPRERALMRDILKRLTLDVEMAIRIALAEQLADDADAPLDLILLLIDDKIEVARPILLRSQKLTDESLLELLSGADTEHQTACAARPRIGEPVTAKLAESDAEPVLVTLVRNATAQIAASTFAKLVEKSQHIASLQEPLARREDLPSALATRLSLWVSDALKAYLVESGRVSALAVDNAVRAIQASGSGEGRRKLIEKLAAADQLKPGFLVRVLQQGQSELFDLGFSRLLGIDPVRFSDIFYRRGPRPAALACHAVGIDRCVFATVYSHSRRSRSINPILSGQD
ncbi:MAG TPA: DUF2336 domain-containing protein, partial [Rhizomicrobium sp.]|nr:DUF2336 domain-containing protein [Rhizomicrobium sp.]